MNDDQDLKRRRFLSQTALGSAAAASLAVGHSLPRLSAQEVQQAKVRCDDSIEPLVRLIESTDRDRVIEKVVGRIQQGTSYQEVMAALQLAGVRNVQPRPAVGFKFHSVLVVNSAHLASLAGPDRDRWLPILWAVDYFKRTQADEQRRSGWTMKAVDDSRLPTVARARTEFVQAMEQWDAEAADVAIAKLARYASQGELFDLFCRFGARDYRSIGHKAIFVANAFRSLRVIGWQHAEPILRSLTFALQNHSGEPNPAKSDLEVDQAGRHNLRIAKQLRSDWLSGGHSESAIRELQASFRSASPIEVSDAVVQAINSGLSAQAAWDAVFLAGAELLAQQPGIIGLHSLTTANALHYAYTACSQDATRRLMLLQAAAFLPHFRQSAADRGSLKNDTLAEMLSDEVTATNTDQIFDRLHANRTESAKRLWGYLSAGGSPYEVLDEARRLIFLKGDDAHDYKFSSAVLEDFHAVSPVFRNEFLAASVFNLKGSGHRDNGLVDRIRAALG